MTKDNEQKRMEHQAVREDVGYHDFTHELLEATGEDVAAFMDKMFVNNLSGADVGKGVYTTMLNEEGKIIDDLIIFRIEENKYWLSTLYIEQMQSWFDQHKEGFDVAYKDITKETTMYAVQGPKSRDLLNTFLDEDINDLAFTRITDRKIDDVPVKVARFGFTGELGYELYFAPEHVDLIEAKLKAGKDEFGAMELTTDVFLSSLPTEKGLKLMRDYEGLDPYEAGLGWSVDWDSDFIGKEAIRESKENGPKQSLVGFTVEDADAAVELESNITKDGEVVGKVTNYTYGFTVEKNIGFALIDNAKAAIGDDVMIGEVSAKLTADVFV